INPEYNYIILEELNVKDVEFTNDASGFISYKFKPQMKTMGPKYGKLMKPIFDEIANLDGGEVMATLNSGEMLKLTVDDTAVEIGIDDVLIETLQKGGFVSSGDTSFTVVLDTNLTNELIEEGFVRELISKIQTMRKDSGFEVQDNITVKFSGSDSISKIFENNSAEIMSQTLALSIEKAENVGKEWNINGEAVTISIAR
ncbi:MAG: DUF5915 domain-containing protein, partial [Oscillospiraceae bacterium]